MFWLRNKKINFPVRAFILRPETSLLVVLFFLLSFLYFFFGGGGGGVGPPTK